ncbi:sensitivity to high expression protein she9 [Rhizina undulata]
MRLLYRSILFARPSNTAIASRLRDLHQLQLKQKACLRCQFQRHQFRLFSSDGKDPTNPPPSEPTTATPPGPSAPQRNVNVPPVQEILKNLPSQLESRRSEYSKRFSKAMDDLQSAVFTAGQRLNDLTGYADIDTMKKNIEQQELHVKNSREEVRRAKEEYQSAINRRSASQREVNQLLQRKHAWMPDDLERFTELYRSDHANEQAEMAALERLTQAERVADEAQAQLAKSILSRYHEEQIWSDKIRRASTWGTWGLMGFNVLLFIVVQLGLEPWKRKRLVGGFEEKVREVIQEENLRNALLMMQPEQEAGHNIVEVIKDAERLAAETDPEVVAAAAKSAEDPDSVFEPESEASTTAEAAVEELAVKTAKELEEQGWLDQVNDVLNEFMEEYFGERQVVIKQADFTTALIESAALGAFLTAVVSLLFSSR